MRSESELTDRQRLLFRFVGFGVILLLTAGILYARLARQSSGDEVRLQQGAAALARAIAGDRDAFAEARDAFGDASGGVIVDPYPVFALELTRRLERGETDGAFLDVPELRPVVTAVARGDYTGARAQLDRAREAAGYAWFARLIDDLERAGEKKSE